MVVDERAVGVEPEHRAIRREAAELSCSVETVVAGPRQLAGRMLAAVPTGESVDPGERPVSADAEDRAIILAAGPAEGRCSIQTTIACQDRKSTRLNCSHPSISYAVFC